MPLLPLPPQYKLRMIAGLGREGTRISLLIDVAENYYG
jgi:hypothetical protein